MIKKGSGVLIALVILLLGLFFLNFHPRSHSSTEKNSYKTVAAEKPLVHFAVIGDYGLSGTPEKDVSQLVKSWQPEFVITVGDNNYPNGEKSSFKENVLQYYGEYINSDFSKTRFFPTLGNHDWMVPNAKGYLESFTLSGKQTYYDFVKGDIHFFVLDSQPDEPDGIEQNSPQAQWLRKGLRTSSQKYRVVYFHHPPYSSGSTHGSFMPMRWPFQEWGASIVLSGHEHLYERVDKQGFFYVTIGTSGYPGLYPFGDPITGSEKRDNSDYGAIKVSEDKDQLNFQYITRKNIVIDSFNVKPYEKTQ